MGGDGGGFKKVVVIIFHLWRQTEKNFTDKHNKQNIYDKHIFKFIFWEIIILKNIIIIII